MYKKTMLCCAIAYDIHLPKPLTLHSFPEKRTLGKRFQQLGQHWSL
jgi:hypothetical protein